MLRIPWFNRIDGDAFDEAVRKTKTIRRNSRRATIPKKRESGKEKAKAVNKVDVRDVPEKDKFEKRVQETQALAQQVNEAYEKMGPRDKIQGGTRKGDVRDLRAMHVGDIPVRQMSAKGYHERNLRDAERRSHHGLNRRGSGGPSPIANPSKIAEDREDNDNVDHQPSHVLKSSRLPNRKDLPDTEPRDHRGFNRRPGGDPPPTAGAYANGADFEEGNDFGNQSQSGTRSSQGLDLSDDEVEGLEEQLLRLRRLDLLGSLDRPGPLERELRETEPERDPDFTRRHNERPFHIPGSFETNDDYENEAFFNIQSHARSGSYHRPAPTHYDDDDAEAHHTRLRRLDSLRHSYSPPLDQNERLADTKRSARQTYDRGGLFRHVRAREVDRRETRGYDFENRRHSLDQHSYGVDEDDDDERAYRSRGEMGTDGRHSHNNGPGRSYPYPYPDRQGQTQENTRRSTFKSQPMKGHSKTSRQEEPSPQIYDDGPRFRYSPSVNRDQRPDSSRRPDLQSRLAEAGPRTHSTPLQQEEAVGGRRHSDVLNPSYGQRISQKQRPDSPRRSAFKSQSTRRDSRPLQEPFYPREISRGSGRHHDESIPERRRSVNPSQRPDDLRHPVPKSQPAQAHFRSSSRPPHQEDHAHGRRHEVSFPLYSQRTSQNQRPDNTKHSSSIPQPSKPQPRPSPKAPLQSEPPRQTHQTHPRFSFYQSITQTQTRDSSRHLAPTSQSPTTHPKSSSRPPRHEGPLRQRPHGVSVSRHNSHSSFQTQTQTQTQTHQQNSSSYPLPKTRAHSVTTHPNPASPSTVPRRGEGPFAPSTQRRETGRRDSSGLRLSRKGVLPRVIPRRE